MRNYVINSNMKYLKEIKEKYLFNKIPIIVLENFPKHIDLNIVIRELEKKIPFQLFKYVEVIYIGELGNLEKKGIQAVFDSGAIFLSSHDENPNRVNNERIIKDIVHELAHSLEDPLSLDLYGDNALNREFLAKRKTLFNNLHANGWKLPPTDFFLKSEYSAKIDDFLYKKIGYNNLDFLIVGLFTSPYSVTSLSEYFANGFEDFFIGDYDYLRKTCPVLFDKIAQISEELGVTVI